MIKADNIAYEYNRRDSENNVIAIERAVDDVSFEVKTGEFIAIVGHNGSGKSTLAKQLNALLTPTEGTLWVNGLDTSDYSNVLKVRQTVGMVFQNPDNQIIANVVEEDVGFGPENLGVATNEIWDRVLSSLTTVDMINRRQDSPNNLSGGQKQRVAIAGVLAMKPKCIVLDEATAMLDPEGRREIIEAITELNRKEHITIILITHYMEEIVNCDRVFVMNKGKLVQEGTPGAIFNNADKLSKNGLELPVATRIAAKLREKGVPVPSGILTENELAKAIEELVIYRKS